MRYMSGNEIRSMWLDFFKSKGHDVEEGASLIPTDDKSLLWMNAGVAPLKKYFDGRKIPKNPRICNAQKCIRTNDIENVGKTSRHHTFFEMLGNFSIGDYFRDEVIPWAFELLTSKKWFDFPKEKLFITYYPDDLATYNKWIEVGEDPSHLIPCEDNFWEIGAGPCGPDTEIFFDRGEQYGNYTTDAIKNDVENDRYIEIWNIVFSQYNSDGSGDRQSYKPLPKKNIDTGAGLERLASVMQNAKTNFDTDLFLPMIHEIEKISGQTYHGQADFKIIADHIRTITFALSDGAQFSNEGRGYVLRRLLRRADKHGIALGIKGPFLYKLVDTVTDLMKGYYPNLVKTADLSKKLIKIEEEKFLATIDSGLIKLHEIMNRSKGIISGSDAFLLFDTYGFPVELTVEYADEAGFKVDIAGFNEAMEAQKERARQAQNNGSAFMKQNADFLNFKDQVLFTGYDTLVEKNATIVKVFPQGFVTDKTPFYAECGGQVGDTGSVTKNGITYAVIDTLMLPNKQHLMVVENPLLFSSFDKVSLEVDEDRRAKLARNHSCAHLMFKALRDVLGNHVSQQGSEITPDFLRFDFNHFKPLSDEEILKVEALTNDFIHRDFERITIEMPIDEAMKSGAIAEFGEKYGENVRVVNLGATVDVCGGTHVNNTKDIERFMALPVSSIGSGIYRLMGLSDGGIDHEKDFLKGYFEVINNLHEKVNSIISDAKEKNITASFSYDYSVKLTGSYEDIITLRRKIADLQLEVKNFDKDLRRKIDEKSLSSFDEYLKFVKGNVAIISLEEFDKAKLKMLADYIASTLTSGTVVLIDQVDGKTQVVIKNQNPSIDASSLLKDVLFKVGGMGGGKRDFAQGGVPNTKGAEEIKKMFEEKLQ